MTGRRAVLTALVLIVTACGGSTGTQDPAPSSNDALAASTTTTMARTTTTAGSSTTTATSDTLLQSSGSQLRVVLASLEVEEPTEITSARIEGSIEMTGLDEETSGVTEGVIRFATSFNTTTGDSSFLMDMSSMVPAVETDPDDPLAGMAAAFLGEIEFREIGERVFVKFPFFTAMLGAETEWISMPEEQGSEVSDDVEAVPQYPREILDAYEDASADIQEMGVETVNGVTATHYRVSLDAEAMDLSPREQAELEESGLFATGSIPMDLWVSEEGHLVRLLLEFDGSEIEAPPEEQFDRMVLRYDVFDINGDVVIEPPPFGEVTAVEDLEGLFGLTPEG